LAGGAGSGESRCFDRGTKGGTAGQLAASLDPDIPEHDSTPAPGARARPDFRHWRTIGLQHRI
jgi:hypothetical protein